MRIASMLVVAGLIAGCGSPEPDDCQRAIARLSRIRAAHPAALVPVATDDDAIESCRHMPGAASGPVLRCAMDAASDAAAATCIDDGIRRTLGPLPGPARAPDGVNPLLKPDGVNPLLKPALD